MTDEVPLKIRVDIRDQWDSKNSSVQEAINSLAKTLGYKVVPLVEWPALWGELKDRFPDKTNFVPTIARITISWYEIFLGRLENEVYETWTEKLLEVTSLASRGNNLTLHIEPCPKKVSRPATKWRAKSNQFYLGIPNSDPPSSSSVHIALEKDFDNLLDASSDGAPKEDDGWADVMDDTKEVARPATTSRAAPRVMPPEPPSTERLPTLDAIARPADLFSNTAPYVLILDHRGNKIWVQSSNERSLELMASYFKKWSKTNHNDSNRNPILKVELNDSDFCFGMVDSLTIEPYMSHLSRNVVLNPTIVLAFIEGVLGYKMAYTNGSYWVYKSDRLLK